MKRKDWNERGEDIIDGGMREEEVLDVFDDIHRLILERFRVRPQ